MKKVFFIFCLLATFNSYAQDLNFDETLAYIKKIIKDDGIQYRPYNDVFFLSIEDIKVEKNGKVRFEHINSIYNRKSSALNLFDIKQWEDVGNTHLNLYVDEEKQKMLGIFYNVSSINLDRLKKAFEHLKKFCAKEKDPFDD